LNYAFDGTAFINSSGHIVVSMDAANNGQAQVTVTISPFTDVNAYSQFFWAINTLYQRNITKGFPDQTFRPALSLDRGAMAAFLYRAVGSPAFNPPASPTFLDVDQSHQFFKEIEWCAAAGISEGWAVAGGREFRAHLPIERQAMAAFLYRIAKVAGYQPPASPAFVDVPKAHPFYKEISWLAQQGISEGWPSNKGMEFRPGHSIERQAMAAFLHRALLKGLL
jgi:hypothetical protein